jgi:hypothetical protein
MPTFRFDHPWTWYALWNLGVFFVALIPHSFMEWMSHRFVLHSKVIVKFAYEEHDQVHHHKYGADETFGIPGLDYGIDFRFRDWLIFLVIIMPMWAALEYWTGKPLLLGAFACACLWLHMFNVIHRHFHAPDGGWLERTWYYRFLREHHRRHHRNPKKNLNVAFLPIADFFLGTYDRDPR